MSRNNKGFTLIEVLIAIFLLLFGMLALLYTMSVAMSSNQQNVIRDEAVAVGMQQMTIVKNTPFIQVPVGNDVAIGLSTGAPVSRNLRSSTVAFAVTTNIVQMTTDTLQAQVIVRWTFKGQAYTHSITSMMARGA